MIAAIRGNGRANHLARVVDAIRYRRAAAEIADIGEGSAIGDERVVTAIRTCRVTRDLGGGINAVPDSAGAAKRSQTCPLPIAKERDGAGIVAVAAYGAGYFSSRVDGVGNTVIVAGERSQIGHAVGLPDAQG